MPTLNQSTDIDPETYKCRQYAQDFQVKSAQVKIPVSDFLDVLNNNGFQLSIASYSGEIRNLFHSYNIAGFLENLAEQAGLHQGSQRNDYIIQTVLKGMNGNALPFRIYTDCVLTPAKSNFHTEI